MTVTQSERPTAAWTVADARGTELTREGLVFAAILVAPLVGFLNSLALVPFLPVVASELGTSVAALGQVTALSMAVATALGLVAGQVADRFGYRRMMLVGVTSVVASALMAAVAPNYAVLLLAGVTGAISRAVISPLSLTIAGTWFHGTTRRRALGWVSAAIAGAAVIGVPLMTTIAAIGSWRIAFFALAFAAAGAAALTWQALPTGRQTAISTLGVRQILAAYGALLRDRSTLAVLGSNFLRSTGAWTVGTYVGAFLVLEHNQSIQQGGLALAAGGLGLAVGSFISGYVMRAIAPRPLLIGSGAIAMCIVGSALALPVSPIWVFILIFAGFVMNGVGTVAASILLVDETRAGQATTMALNGAALSLSSAVGGSVGGLLLQLGGYHAIGFTTPVLGCVAAVLVWKTRR